MTCICTDRIHQSTDKTLYLHRSSRSSCSIRGQWRLKVRQGLIEIYAALPFLSMYEAPLSQASRQAIRQAIKFYHITGRLTMAVHLILSLV